MIRKKRKHEKFKVTNIITKEKSYCNNCKKFKHLYFYEKIDKFLDKVTFTIMMCRDCLSDLKFTLAESSAEDHKEINEDLIKIVDEMLKNE